MNKRNLPMMRSLEVEFIVTEQCNLACKYCYMNNKQHPATVEDAVIFKNKIQKILDFYKASTYNIGFFGGEPLVNYEVLVGIIKELKTDSRCGYLTVITNGLLLDEEKFNVLQNLGVGFSLSFDGLWQDNNRPLVDGKPSRQEYEKKKEFLSNKFHTCKVMISPENISTMTENLEYFVDFGIYFPDFTLVRDDIWSKDDVKLFEKELRRLSNRIIQYYKDGIQVNIGLFYLSILDRICGHRFGKRPFGCFAGCTGIGYLPGGEFFPCARFATEKMYPLYKNEDELNLEVLNDLLNPLKTDPREFEECKECPIKTFCNGGCSYSFLENGNWERSKPIENLCLLYKLIFKETIRLERELKDNELWKNYYQQHILNKLNF